MRGVFTYCQLEKSHYGGDGGGRGGHLAKGIHRERMSSQDQHDSRGGTPQAVYQKTCVRRSNGNQPQYSVLHTVVSQLN